jgi:hypothetical protein
MHVNYRKYLLIPIFLSLFFGSIPSTTSTTYIPIVFYNSSSAISPQPVVTEMIAEVNPNRYLADLRRLTGVEPICTINGCTTIHSRLTQSQNLQWAKDYVREELVNLNYSVEVLNWSSGSYHDQNIIAHKRGLTAPNEEIYLIAHLDGVTNSPAADDDASGVVALLELARILAPHSLSRSVTIFFSTGEEQGALGSQRFVIDYHDRIPSIKNLISTDMLGYDSNGDGKMELWSGDQDTGFQKTLSKVINLYHIDLAPEVIAGCT